jgi:uncharacterized protein (TIGR00369 family)
MSYFGLDIPFCEHCSIRAIDSGPGWTLSEVTLAPHLCNSGGTGHGGLTMTLLDTSMGSAARLSDPSSTGVITVDLHTTFIGPARERLRCRAQVVHTAGRTVFCEASIVRADGQLVARGMGTFRLRHQRPSEESDG